MADAALVPAAHSGTSFRKYWQYRAAAVARFASAQLHVQGIARGELCTLHANFQV